MPVHGKGLSVLVSEYDLSAYLNSVDTSLVAETAETTTFGSSAKSYIVGQRDATISLGGFFDGSAGAVDEVLSAALGASSTPVISICPQGAATIGARALVAKGHDTSYQVTGAVGDAVSISAEFQADGDGQGPAQPGVILADLIARTGTGASLTVVDNGAGTSNGLVANLHVTACAVNTLFTIYHSADNVTFPVLVSFNALSAPGSQQVVVPDGTTVHRYLRLTWSGTAGSRTFAVTAARK